MSLQNILTEKKKQQELLKTRLKFQKKNKILALVIFEDTETLEKLLDWLNILPVDFVVITKQKFKDYNNIIYKEEINQNTFYWFDFVLWDNCITNLLDYLKKWIVPIVPKSCYLNNVLTEFNPLKSEWNAFFYEDNNHWKIFFSLVRYIENYKFPYDNRNLVKNVLEIY